MEQAYEDIKRRVITLEISPGERIDELNLIEELGLSRTPIREALFRLASEGLISLEGRSGFFARPLDLASIGSLLEAHLVLVKALSVLVAVRSAPEDLDAMAAAADEVEAAIDRRDYPAFTRANAEFHRREAAAARSPHLQIMADGVLDQCRRVSYLCFRGDEWEWPGLARHLKTVVRQHAALVAAYRARDPESAQELAKEHAVLFRTRIQARLASGWLDGLAYSTDEVGAPAAFVNPRERAEAN